MNVIGTGVAPVFTLVIVIDKLMVPMPGVNVTYPTFVVPWYRFAVTLLAAFAL